ALEADPAAAAAEYLGQFRADIESFLSVEAIDAVRVVGRLELAPANHSYTCFVDPSGGSQDSFTLAVAHAAEDGRAVLDCVREVRPPFSPDAVCRDFAALVKRYGMASVTGDHYSGQWVVEGFARHGVGYTPSERPKSELY